MSNFCSLKCPICHKWMSRTSTARKKPLLYCGYCGYAVMLLRKSTIENLDRSCQNIEEKDLPPETLKKHQERQQQ